MTYLVNILSWISGGNGTIVGTKDYYTERKLSKGEIINIESKRYRIDAIYNDGTIDVYEI